MIVKKSWLLYQKTSFYFYAVCFFYCIIFFRNVSQSKALIFNFCWGLRYCNLWNIIGTIFKTKKELSKLAEEKKSLTSGSWKQYKKIIIFIGCDLYIYKLILGFWFRLFIHIFAFVYLGMKNLKYSIPQSIITTAVIYGLFALWLNLDLPKGFLF